MHLQLSFTIVLILGLLSAITPLAIDTYLPSIPTIARSIDTDINLVQLTVSIYLFIFGIFQLVFGPLSDAYGRRKVVFIGVLLYVVGSLLCAFSDSYFLLMSGRVVQALGGASVAVCVPALVRDGLKDEHFIKAMSYVFLVMAIAPLVAPILGGVILVTFSWHFIFIFLALIGVISGGLFAKVIPETLPMSKRVPLSFRNIMLTYIRLLANRGVMGHILSGGFHFAGLMCFVTGASFVYIEFYGVKEEYFGLLFGFNVFGMMLVTTLNGQLVGRKGILKMIRLEMVLVIFASCLLAILALMSKPPLWILILSCTAFVCTMGALGSNLMAGALKHAQNNSGSVVALAGTIRFLFGALSGAIVSVLHDGTFAPMVGMMAVSGVLCFTIYFLMVVGAVEPEERKEA